MSFDRPNMIKFVLKYHLMAGTNLIGREKERQNLSKFLKSTFVILPESIGTEPVTKQERYNYPFFKSI